MRKAWVTICWILIIGAGCGQSVSSSALGQDLQNCLTNIQQGLNGGAQSASCQAYCAHCAGGADADCTTICDVS